VALAKKGWGFVQLSVRAFRPAARERLRIFLSGESREKERERERKRGRRGGRKGETRRWKRGKTLLADDCRRGTT
jgi:hypothetical protein